MGLYGFPHIELKVQHFPRAQPVMICLASLPTRPVLIYYNVFQIYKFYCDRILSYFYLCCNWIPIGMCDKLHISGRECAGVNKLRKII